MTEDPRTKLRNQLRLLLGDKLIDVELDSDHYDEAINIAIDKIRQRSDGSTEESHLFMTLQPDVQEYRMPPEVQEVIRIYRRGVGSNTAGGTYFDPLEAAVSNIYLLQSGRMGGIATWDFFSQFKETLGRVFGNQINFSWDSVSKKLTIFRRIKHEEDVLIHVHNIKPEVALLTDTYTLPWIRDYALAVCKFMLGEAREKYLSGLPGPTSNVQLNGTQLKSEATAEMARLEHEVKQYQTGSMGMPFIIG